MLQALQRWWLQRKLARALPSCAVEMLSWPEQHGEYMFYAAKDYLRSVFPGAMIEIAEGTITVVRGRAVAKIEV